MVNLEDGTNLNNSCIFPSNRKTILVETKESVNKIDKFFVKDILNILESKEMKGKTKLKEIRRKIYGLGI